ncbi:MAG: hypothetical protein JSS42_03860, partial [Proteobacteria bacterium]|nr:hypothetical protein [Pseudomonadota bacterium]
MPKYTSLLSVLLFVAASANAADHAVSVGGNGLTFSPSSLTIATGDTVTFHNAGGFHNAVSDTGLFNSGAASSSGWTYTTPAFNTAGNFGYYCQIHGGPGGAGMSGMITVQDNSPPPPTFSIVPGITGSWYLPDQSGHGFNVEVLKGPGQDNGFLAFWYVYDNAGNNLWLVGQGSYVGDTATLNVQSGSGGLF